MRLPLLRSLAVLTLFLSVSSRATADLVRPDSAVASTEFTSGFDGAAVNTINGTGLPAGFSPTDPHAPYASGNHWTTTGGPPAAEFISWGFTAAQTLDTIHIWNHQSTTPPASNAGYDVTSFDLTLFDALDGVLLTLNDLSLAPDTAVAQSFSFGGPVTGVRRVRFDIEAVQSSPSFTGLAEVAFNSVPAAVPEPSSMLLLAGAIGFAGCARRRRYAGMRTVDLAARKRPT
jgi:PEP-CTERM motif